MGPRWASVECVAAGLCAVINWRLGTDLVGLGIGAVAVIGVALAVIDMSCLRLPTQLIWWAMFALVGCFLGAAVTQSAWTQFASALLGGLGFGASMLLLAVLRPGQLGMGDVRLAALLGICLGWFGWALVVIGGCLAFMSSAATILVLLMLRRVTLRCFLPFGPFMLLGSAAALLL